MTSVDYKLLNTDGTARRDSGGSCGDRTPARGCAGSTRRLNFVPTVQPCFDIRMPDQCREISPRLPLKIVRNRPQQEIAPEGVGRNP